MVIGVLGILQVVLKVAYGVGVLWLLYRIGSKIGDKS